MRIYNELTSPLMKNTLKLSLSNVLMYLLPLIVTPILSRIYEPSAFGEWGVFSSVYIIANIGIMLGYENVIVKTEQDNIANISFACFIISIIFSTLIYLFFIIGENCNIVFFCNFPSASLLYVCLLTNALCTIFSNISNRYEKYNIMSIASVVSGTTQALFRILFGTVFIIALNGLIVGTTIAHTFLVFFYVVCLYKILIGSWGGQISFSSIINLIKKYKQFPLFDAPSSILSFAAFNLPIIILSENFSKEEIGCFSMIIQLLLLPMSFVGAAMGKVYYRQLAGCKSSIEIKEISKKVLTFVGYIAILPLLFISLGGDKIIVLFLGDKWSTAGPVALCLSMWSFPTILTQPMLPLLRIKNKLDILFHCNVLYFIGGIGTIFLLLLFSTNLYLILLCYSIVSCIAKFILFKEILIQSEISLSDFKLFFYIWLFPLMLLVIRLVFLFINDI